MNNPLIEVCNLKKYFPVPKENPFKKRRYVKAVNGVSFTVNKGETFGIVGESGCGKTTTGYLIGGLLKPDAGKIFMQNKEINLLDKETQQNIQIIFQDPYSSLNPRKTIGWILSEPLRVHSKMSKDEIKEEVNTMLQEAGFNIRDYSKYPHQLSGGQRQRIGIMAALMLKPQLVIADEPVSALDVSIQASLLNFMERLQQKYQLTYIFISHDLNVVHHFSDRIAVMYLGEVVEIGSADQVYRNPLHPYTKALLSAIPNVHDDDNEIIELKGDIPNPINPPSGCNFNPRCYKCMKKCEIENNLKLKEVEDGHFVACHLYD